MGIGCADAAEKFKAEKRADMQAAAIKTRIKFMKFCPQNNLHQSCSYLRWLEQ
jgi:hypothetical protein